MNKDINNHEQKLPELFCGVYPSPVTHCHGCCNVRMQNI